MSRPQSVAGARPCLHCLDAAPQGDYCHECGPAFQSLSSWGYFRMPDETGVVPAEERDAYGDFGGAESFIARRKAAQALRAQAAHIAAQPADFVDAGAPAVAAALNAGP